MVASVTLSTKSPWASLTTKLRKTPSGVTRPPSKLASSTLVFSRYSISNSVSFTLPGVLALTAIGISTVPTPLSGMCVLKASTKDGVCDTTLPTAESSDAVTELSLRNKIDFQSQTPSSPTSS